MVLSSEIFRESIFFPTLQFSSSYFDSRSTNTLDTRPQRSTYLACIGLVMMAWNLGDVRKRSHLDGVMDDVEGSKLT